MNVNGCYCAVIGLALAALVGCSNGPKLEPADLTSFSATRKVAQNWSVGIGEGGSRLAVRLAPFVGESRVFAVNAGGDVTAHDRKSGRKLWVVQLNQAITAGVSGDADRIYVASSEGEVFSLSQKNGATMWQANVASEVVSAPVAGSGSVIVRSIDGRVIALERATGERRWIYSYKVPALSIHGNGRALAVPDGYLVGLDNGRLIALRARDGRVFWEINLAERGGRSEVDRLSDLDADIQVFENKIYAVNYQGRLVQIDPARGKVEWSVPMSSAVGIAVDEKHVYVTDEFNTVQAVQRSGGKQVWKREGFDHRRLTGPAVKGDVVMVGDFQGYVHLLSAADGNLVGRRKVGEDGIMAAPQVYEDAVFVQDRGGRLAVLRVN